MSIKESKAASFIFLVSLFLLPVTANALSVTVVLKPGYFSPMDTAFREIYGGGIAYGGEAGVNVWKNLDILLKGSSFKRTGELTFTKDETQLKITRIGWGARYRFPAAKWQPYAGLGISYIEFKEANFIGDVSTAEFGFLAAVGTLFALTSRLFVDLSVEYSSCRIKPTSVEVDIGGWDFALGIGYCFGPVIFSSSK